LDNGVGLQTFCLIKEPSMATGLFRRGLCYRSAADAHAFDDDFTPVIDAADLLPAAIIANDKPRGDIDTSAGPHDYDCAMGAVPAVAILDYYISVSGGCE
jgi:hypothetical protein